MHVIEETDTFTLVGRRRQARQAHPVRRRGPARARGARAHRPARGRPRGGGRAAAAGGGREPARHGLALLEAPGGLPLALVERGGTEFDLDHVVLRLPDPEARARASSRAWASSAATARWRSADRELRIVEGETAEGERPLLNHIALLVESADEVQRDAERRGIEIDDSRTLPTRSRSSCAGPDGIRIEYVEHKPGFALV